MSIITIHNIEKNYGSLRVFSGLSLSISKGQRWGLIGPNGCGKTTLLKMIAGLETPDKGQITFGQNPKLSYLPQETVNLPENKTVFEVAAEGLKQIQGLRTRFENLTREFATYPSGIPKQKMTEYEYLRHQLEQFSGWNPEGLVRSALEGVGLGEDLFSLPVHALSGGQRSRLMLARTLAEPSDVLLLDEPSNHLDLQGIEWLESFLKTFKGTLVLISHDRYLLDRIVDRVAEIENFSAVVYKGNYSSFVEQKHLRRLTSQRQLQQRKEFLSRTLDFIARNKDQEGMRKTARGRKTRLKRLLKENPDFLSETPQARSIHIRFENSVSKSEKLLAARSLSKQYSGKILFRNVHFELSRRKRIAITGPNGSGKTTLIRILLGHTQPDEGVVYRGPQIRIGYLDQYAQTLSEEKTVLEEAASARPDLTPEQLRKKLAAFHFRDRQVFQKVGSLSGGQRSRLMLVKMVLIEPDVLVLDEPTNHLDIDSCEALEEALDSYEGAVVAVSHDRYFIDRLFDSMLILGMDKKGKPSPSEHAWFEHLEGDDGVFTQWLQSLQPLVEPAKSASCADLKENKKIKKLPPASAPTPPEIRPFNAWKIEEIEEKILELEEQIENLSLEFGNEETYRKEGALEKLQDILDTKKAELELLYRAYKWRTTRQTPS